MPSESEASVLASVPGGVMRIKDREAWLAAANEEWAQLLQDPLARAGVQAEQDLWDATLMDGLEDEDWGPVIEEE